MATREERSIAALQDDSYREWYATRSKRRIWVGVGAVAIGGMWANAVVSWNLAPSDTAMWVNFVALAVLLALYLPAYSVLAMATRGTMTLQERLLDERQVAERLRVQSIAHRFTSGMLAVVLILFAALLTHFLAPSLIAGWRAADPLPEDDE